MKTLSILIAAGLLLVITSSCFADVDPEAESAAEPESVKGYIYWSGDQLVREAGDWKLMITYLQKGTRSEGQDGVLFKAGIEEEARAESLETPLGTLKHYGSQRKRPWDITGWNLAERSEAKPSQHIELTGPPLKSIPQGVINAVVNIPLDGGTNTVHLVEGGSMEVCLSGRPSTGYSWSLADGYDAGVIRPRGEPESRAPDHKLLGAPAVLAYTFDVLKSGATRLQFEYRRPWEKDKPPTHLALVEVTVLAAPPPAPVAEEPKP